MELPVDEKKAELRRDLLMTKIKFGAAVTNKNWAKAQEFALDMIKLKQAIDPATGISELSDLKDSFRGLSSFINHLYGRGAGHWLELLESNRIEVKALLSEKYGLETKYFLNQKERNALIGAYSRLKSLENILKHRTEMGKSISPQTEAEISQVRDEISQLEMKDETRNG